VLTVPLNIPTGTGWTASLAEMASRGSPLVLLTLRQDNYSQRVRIDLDKKIAIDALPSTFTSASLERVIEELVQERARLTG
jgi:hypothetical protein